MGEVYRARDTRLDRTVAVKIPPAHLSDSPEFKQCFVREARAISSLNHPCEALEVAHRAGIVHRDLKPGNIMLTKSGAKLMDFGLAKPTAPGVSGAGSAPLLSAAPTMSGPSPASPLTTAGSIVGTIQYMSPEQIEGKEADARSDIFAIGTVLRDSSFAVLTVLQFSRLWPILTLCSKSIITSATRQRSDHAP